LIDFSQLHNILLITDYTILLSKIERKKFLSKKTEPTNRQKYFFILLIGRICLTAFLLTTPYPLLKKGGGCGVNFLAKEINLLIEPSPLLRGG
jgi:hypothetical protein